MKKVTFLFMIFCANVTAVFAQAPWGRPLLDIYFSELATKGELWTQVNYKGSPYYSNEFKEGEVLCTSDTLIVNAPLRYNIYSDEIEFNSGDEKIFNLEKSMIKNVKIGDSEFICKDFSSDKKLCHSYFEVLNQGKATLFKKHRVLFEEAKNPKPYEDAVSAQFKTISPYFYIAFGESEALKIHALKDFIKILPDKQSELKHYIKTNHLKLVNEKDLIKIIQFYNL